MKIIKGAAEYAVVIAAAVLLISACGPKPDTTMVAVPAVPDATEQRIAVRRIGIFKDELAYGDRRAIYIITDRQTGKEYFGVSGIGISELGQHATSTTDSKGNLTVTYIDDER